LQTLLEGNGFELSVPHAMVTVSKRLLSPARQFPVPERNRFSDREQEFKSRSLQQRGSNEPRVAGREIRRECSDRRLPAALDSNGGKPGHQPPSDPLSARRLPIALSRGMFDFTLSPCSSGGIENLFAPTRDCHLDQRNAAVCRTAIAISRLLPPHAAASTTTTTPLPTDVRLLTRRVSCFAARFSSRRTRGKIHNG
jgi:hypothetical protein